MAKTFFTSWQTWEKLVFILACAIVLTVFAGCMKLMHTYWKLRKYTALAEKEKMEKVMRREMSQHSTLSRKRDPVPFGIRAIESGIEVEGVWISRTNTPEPASRETSDGTLFEYSPRIDFKKDLERLEWSHPRKVSHNRSYTNGNGPSRAQYAGSVLSERISSKESSREPSLDGSTAEIFETRNKPFDASRQEDGSCGASTPNGIRPRVDFCDNTSEIPRDSNRRDCSQEMSDHSSRSTSKSRDSGPIAASAPSLLNMAASIPKSQSLDLELMQSHRMSQAAETGQLTTRARYLRGSFRRSQRHREESEDRRKRAQQCDRAAITSNLNLSPRLLATKSAPVPPLDGLPTQDGRRYSMPEVMSFQQFCQNASSSPRPEGYNPVKATQAEVELTSGSQSLVTPRTSTDAAAQRTDQTTFGLIPSQTVKRSSFEKSNPVIVRGLGTGFEILKPGTLVASKTSHEKQRSAPPISLHNHYRSRSRSSSADSSRRKLQKKRRPSIDSTTSSDTGRNSRTSVV